MDEVNKFTIEYEYDYTEDVDPKKINQVIKNGFGFGTDITKSIANTQSAILDYDKLESKTLTLLEKDTSSARRSFIIEGKSYSQVTQEVNQAFGLSAKGEKFGNTLKTVTSNKMQNTDDYEYGIRIFLGKAIGVKLKPVSDLSEYVQDKALHDIAGIPVNGRVEYPTNDKGKLKELFKLYGTHIITKAIFGCRYQYIYMRESINQETDLNTQVNCNLTGKFQNENGLGDLGVTLGQSYGESYLSCRNSETDKEFTEWAGGGNLDTFKDWEAGMDFLKPTTIALVGYVMPGTTNDSGLVPLWKIVSDSARAKALENAYNEYLKENITPVRKSKKVIVDVFGRHFSKKDDALETIVEADYQGKVRKFHRLDEEVMDHVTGSTKGVYYFYYALGYSTEGGLSEIKFANVHDTFDSPWRQRGNHADEGVTGCLDDNGVWIKPVAPINYATVDDTTKKNYENNLISGFGIDVEGSKRVSKGADPEMNWTTSGCDFYDGLLHDNIYCIYTKDTLKD